PRPASSAPRGPPAPCTRGPSGWARAHPAAGRGSASGFPVRSVSGSFGFPFHIGLVPVQVGCGARPLEVDAVRWTMAEPEYDVSVVRGIAEASILLSLLFVATILAGVFVTQLLALPPLFPPPWNSVGLVPAIGGGAS